MLINFFQEKFHSKMWTHWLLFIFCVMLFLKIVKMDDRFYFDEDRGICYNEKGFATIPMTKQLSDKMADMKPIKQGTVEKCFAETSVTFGDYIHLKNLELPTTHEGKCFLGCVLQKMKAVDNLYQFYKKGIKVCGSILPTLINTFGKSYIFDAKDQSIYKGIDKSQYVRKAVKIGLDCLDYKEGDSELERCEKMSKFMECIITHKDFNSLKEETITIRLRKLDFDKKESDEKNKKELDEKKKKETDKKNKENDAGPSMTN